MQLCCSRSPRWVSGDGLPGRQLQHPLALAAWSCRGYFCWRSRGELPPNIEERSHGRWATMASMISEEMVNVSCEEGSNWTGILRSAAVSSQLHTKIFVHKKTPLIASPWSAMNKSRSWSGVIPLQSFLKKTWLRIPRIRENQGSTKTFSNAKTS